MKTIIAGVVTIIVVGGLWYLAQKTKDVSLSRARGVLTEVQESSFVQEFPSRVFPKRTSTTLTRNAGSIDGIAIIEATNKERIKSGLTPLAINTILNTSAQYKVDDMIARQYFEHQSPSGEGVSDLGRRAGYEYVIMGENLALGEFADAADIVTAWMESPGHRENILSTKYQDIGVSVKKATYEGRSVWFAVQHFGSARAVCPVINESLKGEIDRVNQELKREEGEISALKAKLQAPGAEIQLWYLAEVSRFNAMVDAYNQKLNRSRQQIDSYNEQVRAFNTCIATFQ